MKKPVIIDPYSDIYGFAGSVLAVAKMKESRLTPEERQANKEQYEKLQAERRLRAHVIENVCPSCKGKLVRGKKDRKNDYKRSWACSNVECGEVFSL